MKKIWLAMILILTLGFGTVNVMAEEPAESPESVIDDARILSWKEKSSLRTKADRLAETYQMDVAVVTTKYMKNTDAQLAADEIFQNNGYGTGDGKDGILLMVSMRERTWAITTHGSAIDLFTDFRQDEIGSRITPYLSEGKYYDAFDVFVQDVEFYLNESTREADASLLPSMANAVTQEEQEAAGEAPAGEEDRTRAAGTEDSQKPWTSETEPKESSETEPEKSTETSGNKGSEYPFKNMFNMSVGGGLVIALIYFLRQRGKMNNVRKEKDAARYMHSDGYEMTGKKDLFLYSKVDKREKPREDRRDDPRRNNPRRGSDHSGTTTHVNRSGERHGGSSGRF